jgi:hypothetical protein
LILRLLKLLAVDGRDEDLARVLKRLRASLGDAGGMLRASDALTLAGFASPSYHRRQVVSRALRELGFSRGRYRVNGNMLYAYVRGTPLEREAMFVVERAADGKPVVKRKEK